VFLHETGSSNPLGLNSNQDKVAFFPFFLYKDIFGFSLFFILVFIFFCFSKNFLEYQNFLEANSLVTPTHIQPE
jgi:ubiquinol-cytochrome c reductase cytochrome b subunit